MSISQAPPVQDLFSDAAPGTERAERFNAYKTALDDSALVSRARLSKGYRFNPGGENGPEWIGADSDDPGRVLSKAITADEQASLREELTKTISLTSPLSTGLVAYDLEAPAKLLAPRLTPLRNIIPRVKGQGKSRQFKRITGISNSGTGGVANLRIGISDTSTATFGGNNNITLNRGPKISYASDEATVNYVQTGLSDDVLWSADFAGQGFQDIRQLSHTALLMAHMNGEEKMLLGGRRTTGGTGVVSAPTAGNFTISANRAAAAGETGNSANIANLYLYFTAETVLGESAASAVSSTTTLSATTGKVVDITCSSTAIPTGATGIRVYAGSATGATNCFYIGRFGSAGATFTVNFTGAGTGGVPTVANGVVCPGATDNSSTDLEYDGVLSLCTGSGSGYVNNLGAVFSTSNPGAEFQNAFVSLYNTSKADPDTIWLSGSDRKQLSDSFKTGGSGSQSFFYSAPTGEAGSMTVGAVISGLLNEVTGSQASVNVHPYLPQGNAVIMSTSIPIADSNITNPWQWVGPQDYMAIDWPVIQHTYDVGTYQYGALVSYATVFSGALTNIKAT